MGDNEFDEAVPEPSEQLDQLQADDTLIDRGVDDVLDEGYVTAGSWKPAESDPATIDRRLKAEEPENDDSWSDDADDRDDAEDEVEHEVGRLRAGRLVDAATEGGADVESELYGEDVGFAGGAASAEEAAVHIIDETEPETD